MWRFKGKRSSFLTFNVNHISMINPVKSPPLHKKTKQKCCAYFSFHWMFERHGAECAEFDTEKLFLHSFAEGGVFPLCSL